MTTRKVIHDIYEEENDESNLINPNDLPKRRREVIEDEDVKLVKEIERTGTKYYNTGGMATVEFETMGRFNMPAVMQFNDYTAQDINDITLSRQEDLFKNLIVILNRAKDKNIEVNIEDMLMDELFEVLIGMKMEFTSKIHEHPWVCECQYGLDYESQTVNTTEIDLTTLQYKSIEDADKEMRSYYSEIFKSASEEEFRKYLETKYKKEIDENSFDVNTVSVESEIEKLKIVEPIGFKDTNGNIYSFRFVRVKDILDATRLVNLKYSSKFKNIKNRKAPENSPLIDFKNKKEKELEELQFQQGKDLILYAKAFSLVKYNGKTLSKDESVSYYKNMPRNILFRIDNFFNQVKFGIVDERVLECPICGRTSRRSLRLGFNPFEFLPLELNSNDIQRRTTGLNILIGV